MLKQTFYAELHDRMGARVRMGVSCRLDGACWNWPLSWFKRWFCSLVARFSWRNMTTKASISPQQSNLMTLQLMFTREDYSFARLGLWFIPRSVTSFSRLTHAYSYKQFPAVFLWGCKISAVLIRGSHLYNSTATHIFECHDHVKLTVWLARGLGMWGGLSLDIQLFQLEQLTNGTANQQST